MRSRQYLTSLFTLAITLLAGSVNAQPGIDSISKLLKAHQQQDKKRVALMLSLANAYEMVSSDSVYKLSTGALQLSEALQFKKGIAGSYEMVGAALMVKGKPDSALYYYNKAIAIAKENGLDSVLASKYNHIGNLYFLNGKYADANIYYDSAIQTAVGRVNLELLAKANSNLANVYYKMGNYTNALNYYLKGLKVQEQLGIEANIASDLANIANVYYRLGQYSKALAYTNRSLALNRKSGNKERIAGTLTTYAMIYNDRKMYDSSLYYLKEALQLAKDINSPYLENILIGNLAECYLKKGDHAQAGALYSQTLQLSGRLGDAEGLAIAKAGLGDVYLHEGNAAKGRQYLEEALQMMQQLGIREQALSIATKLSESYKQSGDYKMAYQFLAVQTGLSDSLKKEQSNQEAEQLFFNYELEKKEHQIKLLEKDKAIQESKNQNQMVLIWSILSILLLMGVAAYQLYRNTQKVKKSRQLVLKQKEEIEEQAQKLTELNEFKDATFSLLAHDLRSPVNALASTMMLLDEGVMTPQEFVGYKQELNNKLQSVSILIDNMLYWARSQMKGEFTLEIEKVNIRRNALRAISVLKDAASQKNITIANNISEDIWALADRDHIDIVIRNIISNAVKFTREHGTITLTADSDSRITGISIADNGVGMTAEQIERLFADNDHSTTKGTEGEKGTGLGLSLCYDLVKKNKGDIKVTSVAGQGTVFTILLPAI